MTLGEVIAACILAGANIIESRLAHSAEIATKKLDVGKKKVVRRLSHSKNKKREVNMKNVSSNESDDNVVILKYSNGARRVSKRMKEKTEDITLSIRGAAAEAVVMISEKAEEVDVAGKLCPHSEGRDMLEATGKVAVTGLGAAAIVGEAIYDSTKVVAKKSCEVTTDVARLRYGENAAQLVENTGVVLGNAFRTLLLVTQIYGDNFTRAVARDSGKVKLNRQSSEKSVSNNCGSRSEASFTTKESSSRKLKHRRSSSFNSSISSSKITPNSSSHRNSKQQQQQLPLRKKKQINTVKKPKTNVRSCSMSSYPINNNSNHLSSTKRSRRSSSSHVRCKSYS